MKLRFQAADVQLRESETAWSGYFSVQRLTVQHKLFGGGWSDPVTREVFERGDAVGVLLYDPRADALVMLEQFRIGALRGDDSPWMFELVAGVVEEGESDADVAQRETEEESGLTLGRIEAIARFYPSAGACSEQIRLFVGEVDSTGAGGVHGCDDEAEDIAVHVVSREDVLQDLADGQIDNGHTLIALQWLQIHAEALRQRWL